MIERRTIFDIHRLANDGFSVRKIAATLGLDRQTVRKYLDDPSPQATSRTRASQLDPFKDDIASMLETASFFPSCQSFRSQTLHPITSTC
jgi:transposase